MVETTHSHRENPALPPSKHVAHMLAGEREPASPSACGSCRRARGRAPGVHVRQPPPCDKIRGFPTFRCFATRHDARKRRTDRLKSIARRRLADMRACGAARALTSSRAQVLREATRGRASAHEPPGASPARAQVPCGVRASRRRREPARPRASRPPAYKKTRAEARVAWLL